MSEMYEGAVALYLTRPGDVFLSQQYINNYDKENRDGGTVPDFVALDFSNPEARELIIVEVTTASNWTPLAGRVEQRVVNWYRPVVRKLLQLGVVDEKWKVRFLGFVRDDNLQRLTDRFATQPDVTFTSLESSINGWLYWEDRMSDLPGRSKGITLSSFDILAS